MTILDGKWLSNTIKEEIARETQSFLEKGWRKPMLTAVLAGVDPASQFYVRSKMRACKKVGFDSQVIELPGTVSEKEILDVVHRLNLDENVDGYIVQLPLPEQVDEAKVIEAVDPVKDVDGFHPVNLGKMAIGLEGFIPATPLGVLQFFKRYKIETEGKHAVVLGRSNIVGTPMSILLSRKSYPGNCTVTQVHSRTRNLGDHVKQADIVIAAIGRPNFVTEDMVKEGAVVIDVGINRVEDATTEKGYRIVGDVDFEAVSKKASFITPVPGGVGLMTVTSLLMNTLTAYKRRYEKL